jgi:hypothetical protein
MAYVLYSLYAVVQLYSVAFDMQHAPPTDARAPGPIQQPPLTFPRSRPCPQRTWTMQIKKGGVWMGLKRSEMGVTGDSIHTASGM